MSKSKRDIILIEDDIEFLHAYQKELQGMYVTLKELSYPRDFATIEL